VFVINVKRLKVLKIVYKHLPEDSPIFAWLAFGEFDTGKGLFRRSPEKLRKKYKKQITNAPANRKYEYWVEGKRNVEPLHAKLQAKFVQFLETQSIESQENINCIDVQYNQNGQVVFAEIKPTDNIETRYAIRCAVGQLLEYQFKYNRDAKLEIVLGRKPTEDEEKFVSSLGMLLSYYSGKDNNFLRMINEAKI